MTPTLASGEILKNAYVVERLLGTDLFCQTYAITDEKKTKSFVGVRVLPELAHTKGYLKSFQDAARRLLTIRHRHLIGVVDFWAEDADRCFLMTEELIGHSLRSELTLPRQHTPLPRPLSFTRSQSIYRQICEALDALHAGGCLHLDLRPENVHLNNTNDDSVHVALSGMGIVCQGLWSHLNCPDEALPYQAPEQLLSEPVSEKSDQFVLASAIYEMLKGSQAFHRQQDTRDAVIFKIKREDPIPFALPSQAVSGFSRALNKAFSKHPQQRHSSIREFCYEIGIPLTAVHSSSSVVPPTAPVSRLWWPAVGCAVLGLAAGAMMFKNCDSLAPGPDAGLVEPRIVDLSTEPESMRDLRRGDASEKTANQPVPPFRSRIDLGTGAKASAKLDLGGGAKADETKAKKTDVQTGSKADLGTAAKEGEKPAYRTVAATNTASGAKAAGTPANPLENKMGSGATGTTGQKSAGGQKISPGGNSANGGRGTHGPSEQSAAVTPSGSRNCAHEFGSKSIFAPTTLGTDQKKTIFECLTLLDPCEDVATIEIKLLNNKYMVTTKSSAGAFKSSSFRGCIRGQLLPNTEAATIKVSRGN